LPAFDGKRSSGAANVASRASRWFAKPGEPPVAIEDKPPVVMEEKAPVVDKANDAGPQPDEVSGKRGLTPNCEKELRRTADLLRFFANRIQTGEEIQSVVADVTQQEKRIAAVCPEYAQIIGSMR
jgi:hypothetical protein